MHRLIRSGLVAAVVLIGVAASVAFWQWGVAQQKTTAQATAQAEATRAETKRRKPLMHRQPPRPKRRMLVLPKLRLRLRQQTLGRLAQLRLQKNEKQRNTHWT